MSARITAAVAAILFMSLCSMPRALAAPRAEPPGPSDTASGSVSGGAVTLSADLYRSCILSGRSLAADVLAPYLCLRGIAPGADLSVPGAPAVAPDHVVGACVPVQGVDDRCEQWTIVYDDPDIPSLSYQFPMALTLSPDGATAFLAVKDVAGNQSDPYSSTSSWVVLAMDAASGERLWLAKRQGPGGYDFPLATAVSPDGSRLYVTGASYDGNPLTTPSSRAVTIAYDARTGAQLWKAAYDSPYGGIDNGVGIVASNDGSHVYVVAVSDTGHGDLDYETLGYGSARGKKTWAARYMGVGGGGVDAPFGIGVAPNGKRVFVTGWSAGTAEFDLDYGTVAYEATGPARGSVAWEARYDGIGADLPEEAFGLAVSPDGTRVVVVGLSGHQAGTAEYDYGTVAYRASTGQQAWDARYAGPGGRFNVANAVAIGPGGRVFVTGQSTRQGRDSDYGTVAYDQATGTQLWAQEYGVENYDFETALSVAASPDGQEAFVTGLSSTSAASPLAGSVSDQATLAYGAADGAQLWVARLNSNGSDFDEGMGVVAGAGGRVVAAAQWTHQADTSGNGNTYDTAVEGYGPAS